MTRLRGLDDGRSRRSRAQYAARSASDDPAKQTPADNQTVRNIFVIGPDKKITFILVYPMTTGWNFDEVRRALDSLQLSVMKVATPANWQSGEEVIIQRGGEEGISARLEGAAAISVHRASAEAINRMFDRDGAPTMRRVVRALMLAETDISAFCDTNFDIAAYLIARH